MLAMPTKYKYSMRLIFWYGTESFLQNYCIWTMIPIVSKINPIVSRTTPTPCWKFYWNPCTTFFGNRANKQTERQKSFNSITSLAKELNYNTCTHSARDLMLIVELKSRRRSLILRRFQFRWLRHYVLFPEVDLQTYRVEPWWKAVIRCVAGGNFAVSGFSKAIG